MTARRIGALALALVLAGGLACGKVGPPRRAGGSVDRDDELGRQGTSILNPDEPLPAPEAPPEEPETDTEEDPRP